ncbi:glycosyltransferase [Ancylomarina salipaludis]|uniref:Glycosyltransferase n=1 Tax=Ancylomarina salipaludis TaxID=2501299 RepID=A0A4Q1JKH7_9BACT|nr:ATP-grasp fold amidoligase family protein [Ancylomarina salipaludis]RXQ93857.1 glycosyltransferase [Ancylomarina salipaludis]
MKLTKNIKNLFATILFIFPDRLFCTITFLLKNRRLPDLNKPVYFNDKLLWLKLNRRDPIQNVIVDKFAVRNYIKEKIGEEYLIPLIGLYNNFEGINFDELPNKFVLKITNGSQNNIVCTDKSELDWIKVSNQVNKWLNINYYKRTREWQYKDVKAQIIIEHYLDDPSGDLCDYKFYCFNGEPKFIQIDSARFASHKRDFYNIDFNEKLKYKMTYPNSDSQLIKPDNYKQMVSIAKRLSNNFEYLRVDLYNVKGKVYFGELTLYPDNCNGRIESKLSEYEIGSLLILNELN